MTRLTELFPGVVDGWPTDDIGPIPGPPRGDGVDAAARARFFEDLDSELSFEAIRTQRRGDDTVVWGKVEYTRPLPGPRRIYVSAFPSFTFLLEVDWTADFFVRTSATSTDVIIENVSVHVEVPADFISGHEDSHTSSDVVEFDDDVTTFKTEWRIRWSTDGEFRFEPVLPLSIAPAKFMGISCRGIYDIRFFPQPRGLNDQIEWIRRPVDQFTFDGIGAIGMRTLDIDWADEHNPIVQLMEGAAPDDAVKHQWVFDDIVIPVVSPYLLPLPRHGKFGARKLIEATNRLTDYFDLTDSPISIPLSTDVRFVVEKFWFDTIPPPADAIEGLEFEVGIIWDMDDHRGGAFVGLEDEWSVTATIRRSPRHDGEEVAVLGLNLFNLARLDLIALKTGVSIGKLLRGEDFGNSFMLTVDMLIGGPEESNGSTGSDGSDGDSGDEDSSAERERDEPGTTSGDGGLALRTPADTDFSIAITDLGWKYGTFSIETVQLPKGSSLELGPLELILFEMGVVYEGDAAYFCISGGIGVKCDGFEVAVWFRRIRGKVSGSPDAPIIKMDGFGGRIGNPVVLFEFAGYFTNETINYLPAEGAEEVKANREEFGLAGTLKIDLQAQKYEFGFDLIIGGIDPEPADIPSFDFGMIQIAFKGQIPAGVVAIFGFRVLFAWNMLPKLEAADESVPQLRYYHWSKSSDPLKVPADRRLGRWRPENDAWAVGVGLTISLCGMGDTFRISAFGMVVHAPSERGFMIGLELFILSSDEAIGYAVFEYDLINDRFAIGIGVDMNLKHFLDNPPEMLAEAFAIKANLLIGNKPGTFALGRLNDLESWAALTIKIDLAEMLKLSVLVALCVEWVEDTRGGFGIRVRGELGVDCGILLINGYAGIFFVAVWLLNGSGDCAVRAEMEMGLRISILRIIQIGLKLSAEIEHLAHAPTYTVFSVLFEIETPWFLPNISYACECLWGSLEPERRAAITGALREATGLDESSGKASEMLIEVARPSELEEPVVDPDAVVQKPIVEVGSIEQFADAVARRRGSAPVVAPNQAVVIDFVQPVEDLLRLSPSAPEFGTRRSGDDNDNAALFTRYRLAGLRVKRRPRFEGGEWTLVEERYPDFLVTEDGVERAPQTDTAFSWKWKPDPRSEDKTVANQLVFNGNTPFGVTTEAPAVDDSILRENPNWPCCDGQPTVFQHDVRTDPLGHVDLPFSPLDDVRANIWIRDAFVKPPESTAGLGSDVPSRVLSFDAGTAWRFTAHEDVMIMMVRCCALIPGGTANVVAQNRHGEEVYRQAIDVSGPWAYHQIVGPFRNVWIESAAAPEDAPSVVFGQGTLAMNWIEVDRLVGITVDEYAAFRREASACDRDEETQPQSAFLFPQHEYRIELDATLGVKHTSTEWEETTITEAIEFATSGFPGTNLVETVGEELTNFVVRSYDGNRGILYREEPTFVLFNEDFRLLAPGGPSEEARQFFGVSLAVRSDSGRTADELLRRTSTTTADWLSSRMVFLPAVAAFLSPTWLESVEAKTDDLAKLRLANLIQRSENSCGLDDPSDVTRVAALTHGEDGLWESAANYTAFVRPQGSPWIRRKTFSNLDLAAFRATGRWAFDDGALRCQSDGTLGFGDADWDLFSMSVGGSGEYGVHLFGGAIVARIVDGRLVVGEASISAGDGTLVEVRVFADVIRFVVGSEKIDVTRNAALSGPPAILGSSGAMITSLSVTGVDMHQHPFRSSAYTSFEEHIGSLDPTSIPRQPGDAVGLVANADEYRRRIAEVMTPTSTDAEREELFDHLASELVIFLQDGVTELTMSSVGDPHVGALLLESPEPIDVATEVRVTLSKFVPRRTGRSLADLLNQIRHRLLPRGFAVPELEPALNPIERLLNIERVPTPVLRQRQTVPVPAPITKTLSAERSGSPKQRWSCTPPLKIAPGVDVDTATKPVLKPLHRLVAVDHGQRVVLRAADLSIELDPEQARIIRESGVGGIDIFDDGTFIPTYPRLAYEPVRTDVIQNTDATRLLILPSAPLGPGEYRLDFEIVRRRWETTQPEDELNTYRRSAAVDFQL